MARFLWRRLAHFVPTLLAVTLIIFTILNLLPGSAALMRGDDRSAMDADMRARIERELGLDQPVPVRFVRYLGSLAQGDLGRSFMNNQPVAGLVADRLWPSLKLAVAAMLIALALGIPLGFLSALRQGTWVDTLAVSASVCGVSMPQFWLGLLLMYAVSVWMGLLPTAGYSGNDPRYLILPALTLGLGYMALLARTTRAAVIDILNSDYVRTAHAKGLSDWLINRRHVLRNALVLILTTAGLQLGTLMGQAVVVEKLFSWPGLGSLLVDSIFVRDLPVSQGCILVMTLFFLCINLIVDFLYAIVDPRIDH